MSGSRWLHGALLVAAGGAAGAIGGALVADGTSAAVSRGDPAAGDLEARVAELEARLEERAPARERRRVRAADEAGPTPVPGAPEAAGAPRDAEHGARARTSGGDVVAPSDAPRVDAEGRPAPEFVEAVRRAIDELKREAEEGAGEKRLAAEREKKIAELRKTIPEIARRLGLTEEETRELGRTAWAGFQAVLDAKQDGLTDEEVRAVERQGHRDVRDLLGGDRYREMRKLEFDAAARPTIAQVASLAGVDPEQRDRIERLLTTHIESLVDDEIRARTEEMPADLRRAIHERLDEANRTAWDRIRNEILDAEQRGRVPVRLR